MSRYKNLYNSTSKEKLSFRNFFKFLKRVKIKKITWFFLIILAFLIALLPNVSTFLVGYIIDKFLGVNFDVEHFEMEQFVLFIVIISLLVIFMQLGRILQGRILNKAIIKMIYELRIETYKKIQNMPLKYFDSKKTGDIMSSLTNDINNIMTALLDMMSSILVSFFQFVISFVIMFIYAPSLGAITLFFVPISLLVFYGLVKNNQKHFIKQQETIANFQGYLEEIIDAIPLIRLNGQQEKVTKLFDKYNKDLIKPEYSISKRISLTISFSHFMRYLITLVVVAIGIVFLHKNIPTGGIKPLSVGLLITFSVFITNINNLVAQTLEILNSIQLGFGSIVRVQRTLDIKLEFNQSELKNLNYKQGLIEFKDVSFAYAGNENKLILNKINFTIEPGKTVALVGFTGAGKTTIAKLLNKFYLPTSGQVLIDQQSSLEIKDSSWRSKIDMILQDTYIFNASLRENLRLFDERISDEFIYKKVDEIIGRDFIDEMPKGLETQLESNAKNLSHGQKQLISIIRSLITNRPITILDEATSSIDTVTEKRIQKSMDFLIQNRSSLVIAHRLSTIKNADLILLIENGEIIERGTHQELINFNGKYKKLYEIGFDEN
ncbi:multidrug resistance ABC transporter [Mycoplasmopsis columbina SF7]|uniref:Multidrug resistance ABC transporter n=1 Tax=Mycoplasmopsis columbina SF7 TaxID=1037410 RepID=F9UK50_9BACT|nr:ABC transporter ATP-binding protein [Mycoplasmopsis columbina]EGV00055.1 multidrug resistance ABC transporter [Mycoplasmopsis columbina SF7]